MLKPLYTQPQTLGVSGTGISICQPIDPFEPLLARSVDQFPDTSRGVGRKTTPSKGPSSFLFLVVRPGAPSSVLVPSSKASLFLVVRPGAPSSVLVPSSKASLFLVVRPGAPSSVLVPGSKARSP